MVMIRKTHDSAFKATVTLAAVKRHRAYDKEDPKGPETSC